LVIKVEGRTFGRVAIWIPSVCLILGIIVGIQVLQEWKNDILLSDILSNVDGDKYSIIGEGIYERQFEAGRLGGGLKHTQSWTDNTYSGTVGGRTKMKQSETYLYTEFSGRVKKLNYTAGIGVSRSWFKQEGEEDYQYYTFRPKVSLQYNFTDNMYFRVNGSVNNVSPSLSELSAIEQHSIRYRAAGEILI